MYKPDRFNQDKGFQFLNMSIVFMYRLHARERAVNLLKTLRESERITHESENELATFDLTY